MGYTNIGLDLVNIQHETVSTKIYLSVRHLIVKQEKKDRIINHLAGIFREFLKSPNENIPRFTPTEDVKIIYISQKQDEIFIVKISREMFEKSKGCKNEVDIKKFLESQDLIIKHVTGRDGVKILLKEPDFFQWRIFWIPPSHNPFYTGVDSFDYSIKGYLHSNIFHPEEMGYSRCLVCFSEFYSVDPNQLYCSPHCRKQAAIMIRRDSNEIEKQTREANLKKNPKLCHNPKCKNPLSTTARSHAKFCNDRCRMAYHNEERKKKISG